MKANKQMLNLWNSGSTYAGRYENLFEYDANGNITTQIRKDAEGNAIDELTYQYAKEGGKLHHNRLYHLNDAVTNTAFDDDIDDIGTFGDANLSAMMFDNNYEYDEIGNLIKDQQEEIDSMVWRPDRKLEKIIRSSSSGKLNLKFDYDVSGNRIAKHVIDNNDNLLNSTYYVRDAQGNVMSVYKLNIDTVQQNLAYFQKERHIYGSSMLGMDTDSLEMIGASVLDTTIFNYMVGDKRYSMSNHLGNVLAVVTDKKLPIDLNQDTLVDYYQAEVFSTSDYSPFGVVLDGRNFNSEKFRYGMGNHEKDGEVQKDWYDFGGFGYDPRRVQRPKMDPKFKEITNKSPYVAYGNNPILFVDPDGRIIVIATKEGQKQAAQVLSKAFGKQGANFSFNDDNQLTFSGNINEFDKNEKEVFDGLNELMTSDDVWLITFQKTKETDAHGGEATNLVYTTIDIDPIELFPTTIGENYKTEYFSKHDDNKTTTKLSEAKRNIDGLPLETGNFQKEPLIVKDSKAARFFHGIGHALNPTDDGKALDFDNKARSIFKKENFRGNFKSNPEKSRSYDATHPKPKDD